MSEELQCEREKCSEQLADMTKQCSVEPSKLDFQYNTLEYAADSVDIQHVSLIT